jgi:hypothetical protein
MNAAIRHCRECKTPLAVNSGRGRPKLYCSVNCNKAFDNRRMIYGAVVFDLVATMRFERSKAKRLGVWATLCRVMKDYHEAHDHKIWRDIEDVLQDVTHLRFTAKVQDMTGRRKRA